MPAPSKITHEEIVRTARQILERDGEDGLTMRAVAAELDVRAPSLYKHLRDRADLLDQVRDATLLDLGHDVAAIEEADPAMRLLAYADATRAFGVRWPVGKAMAFGRVGAGASAEVRALTIAPVLSACEALVGREHALNAARTIVAWTHGFTDMERAGAFRLGGGIDDSYRAGIEAIVAGWRARTAGSATRRPT